MAAGLKMSLKLSQQLRMTPQLQQAIKLLQLSRVELEDALRKELNENPVLEELHETAEDDAAKNSSQTSTEVASPGEQNSAEQQDPRKQDEFDWESYVENQQKPTQSAVGSSDEIMNYENIISETKTLHDHLNWQVGLFGFNDEEENIARILISYVNDDGYIKTPFADISTDEEIPEQDLEDILPFVQEFDPPGVAARDLKECLLIQAKHIQEDTHDLVALINNHLKDLEKKNYPAIAKEMELDVEVVVEMSEIILSMDPKPGRAFTTQDTHYVTPDVYVYKVGDEYVVSLNEDGLPRLRISNLYKNLIQSQKENSEKAQSKDTQEYIQDKLRSAVWLIKSIHQRQRTIYKVTESIVKHQEDFFEKGAAFIKPMILRDIANDIGMHESTVSRVTTNKFVHTPLGIYELKYFFNSGLGKSDGNSVASESVKLKIKDMVSNEDPKKPLSDQKIVDLLKKDGIQIARRTVAKYRDVLKILPSSKRKKYY